MIARAFALCAAAFALCPLGTVLAQRMPAPPVATPMPATSDEVDPKGFRFTRALPEGPAGLVALVLDPAILAHSRGPSAHFADVRIIDAANRQIPYLIERREEPLALDLELKPFSPKARELRSENGRRRSVYALHLPHAGLPSLRLVFETSARVFQRTVQVGVERPPDRRHRDAWFDVKGASEWSHADEATVPAALTMAIGSGSDTEILIAVHEGDNQPLPITAARALLPSYRLRFYQPPGPLRVVYGQDGLAIPQYDLTLLASQVMGADAREIAAAPADTAAPGPAAQLLSPQVFWIGLGAAVLILLAIIARLLRTSSAVP